MNFEVYREDETTGKETILNVEVNYVYDPGCRTMSNGDPGWPDNEDMDVVSVSIDGKKVENDLTESELDALIVKAREEHGEERCRDDEDDGEDDEVTDEIGDRR